MTLLISETFPADAVLDRAIPRMDDVYDYLASQAADDERAEHEGRLAAGPEPAWYEPRISALRQVILGIF